MSKVISKILKITSSALILIAALLAFLLVGMRIFGFQIYTILSPSMEPKYPTGAIIYVKKCDTQSLKNGDVITFQLTDNMTATHRIVKLVSDEENPDKILFRTKGDNNDEPDDALVEPGRVLGKVVFSIPLLGILASYIQTRTGLYTCLAIAAAIMLLVFLSDMFVEDDKKRKNEESAS